MKSRFPAKHVVALALGATAVFGCVSLARQNAQPPPPQRAQQDPGDSELATLEARARDLARTVEFTRSIMYRDMQDPAKKPLWKGVLDGPWVDYCTYGDTTADLIKLLVKPATGEEKTRWVAEARDAIALASKKQAEVQLLIMKDVLRETDAKTLAKFKD